MTQQEQDWTPPDYAVSQFPGPNDPDDGQLADFSARDDRSRVSQLRETVAKLEVARAEKFAEYEELTKLVHERQMEIALHLCPFVVGDVINLAHVFFHMKRAVVVSITTPRAGDSGEYSLEAIGLKKDGTRSETAISRKYLQPRDLEPVNADLVALRLRGALIPPRGAIARK